MVIVYTSNTGFTKAYAEMLGKAEKMKVYELDSLPADKEQEVFYMGPLMNGKIQGTDQALKRFTVKAVCGVGMSPAGPQILSTLSKVNYVPNAPMFYLQGGWAPDKVGWLKRRMVNAAAKSQREALLAKANRRTRQEQAQLEFLIKGGNCVSYKNLDTIRNWLKEQREE